MRITPIAIPRPRASWLVGLSLLTPAAFGQAPTSATNAQPGRTVPEALDFANRLYRERRYDLAAEQFELFLKDARPGADPDAANARFGLGNARLFLGKYREARQAFEDFVRSAPDHPNAPTARYRIGETAYVLNDLPAARRSLEAYTASGPADRRYLQAAWSHLGDVDYRLGDLPAARKAYENALVGDPQGSLADRARLGRGRVLAALNETEPALQALRGLAERGGPEWLDKAQFEIGRIEASSDHWLEAANAFEAAEKAAPRGPMAVEARVERAEALLKLKRVDEAEALLRPIAEDPAQPLAPQAADALGASLLARGKAAEALATLEVARSRFAGSPSAPILQFHAAEAVLAAGRPDEARTRFLQLVEDDPRSPLADDAQLRAASLALDAKDWAAARQAAGPFDERFPQSPLRADARLIDARAALSSGQPKDAIEILTGALAEDRPSPAVAQAMTYYLGLAYQRAGQADQAAEVFGRLAKTPAPLASDAQYLLGQTAFDAGRFADAVPALQKYLADRPDGEVADHALARLAQSQSELGQAAEADASLAKLAEKFPRSPTLNPTRSRLAESALAAGEFDRAAGLFRASSESAEPAQKAGALSGLGWSLLRGGHPAEAAETFEALLEASPDDRLAPEAALARAFALNQAGRPEEAIAAYASALEKSPKSPQAGPASLALARLRAQAKQPEAAQAYESVARDHPEDCGEPLDSVLSEWGWTLVDLDRQAEADDVFGRLLRDFPESPRASDARYNLAVSAFAARDFDRALDLLKPLTAEGAESRPTLTPPALILRGRAQAEKADWAGASSTFARLIAADSDGTYRREARFWKAEVAFKSGDAGAAEPEFAALAAEAPAESDFPGLASTARARQVQCLAQLGRWQDTLAAADAFQAAGSSDPLAPEVEYARGRACQGLARFDEARQAFDKVLAARKGTDLAARAQLMRGETYFHQNMYRDALREFYRVILQYNAPEWQSAALLEAGKVHEKLDQWKEAAESYENLIKARYPNDRNVEEATRRLEAARRRAGQSPGADDASNQ
ncbi:tetratricopeptide repeat protein [Tundrisphaera lichenicola]|uniref:tetratricopeptide repeat protein n=1 Tax=Tundrisphaera lichenicola TaxID=2029860 RepID=UPI003EBD6BA1